MELNFARYVAVRISSHTSVVCPEFKAQHNVRFCGFHTFSVVVSSVLLCYLAFCIECHFVFIGGLKFAP